MKKTPPSVIPLTYDYQKMSPSSTTNQVDRSEATTSFYDNQYQSLFGDPVPPTPSEDYLGHLDGSFYGSFRRDSYASAIADDFNRTITLAADGGRRLSRLFSETPITSTSAALSPMVAPDIQILPDSGSGESSSDAQATPNYMLLGPNLVSRPSVDEAFDEMQEASGVGMANYEEQDRAAKEVTRRILDFSEDFKSNVGSLRESPPEIPEPPSRYTRQISNESYSSNDWFKPMSTYPDFTKMPKLRPSSKNVLSIKHHEMPSQGSPVAAMIDDSNASSSGEDQRKEEPVPARPPDPQPSRLKLLQQLSSTDSQLPPAPPLPPPPAPLTLPPPEPAPPPPIVRQRSPVIITDTITTGAEHRVTAPRTHKKSSFTIIGEKSPQSSRDQSPPKALPNGRISPFLGHGFREPEKHFGASSARGPQKPVAKPRMLQQKSLSSTHLKLPSISSPANNLMATDDSPRPSVQFNMSGKREPMQMTHQKGILQMGKDPPSSSQATPQPDPLMEVNKMKSCEALPLITDPYRSAIPRMSAATAPKKPIISNPNPTRKQRGLLRVINSADSGSRIPVRSNWASMDDLSSQRKPILSPLRLKARRRSSSTSPERRSSTQTEPRSSIASDRRSSNLSSVTTSDFSFRRNSLSPVKTPVSARRKSVFQPRSRRMSQSTPASPSIRLGASRTPRKVVKPTTLSPIIGTPNKDLPQIMGNTNHLSPSSLARIESLSKIPIRNGSNGASRSNSRLSSRANSRMSSRSSSPFKEFVTAGSRVTSSRSPSRQTLRPESRLTSRGESRPVSRIGSSKAPSRSTSRASTREASRAMSQAQSRASTRPNSRMEDARAVANSRSNSRLSTRSESPLKSRKASPPKSSRRSKSSSYSPDPRRARRKSISPAKIKGSTPILKRRNSQSRIPARVPTTKKSSSPKLKAPTKGGPRKESPKRSSYRKQPISAKKPVPSSMTKTGTKKLPVEATSVRRTQSSVKKPSKVSTSAQNASKSRQSSNLQSSNLKSNTRQKSAFELKRETSSVRQAIIASAKLKKEASSLSVKNLEGKADGQASSILPEEQVATGEHQIQEETPKPNKPLKRQPSTMTLLSIGSKLSLLRKRTDSNLSKKLEDMKKNADKDGHGTTNGHDTEDNETTSNGKLVALTKANVVSMTTAAITAQPVQISSVLANQLPKTNSSGQLLAGQEDMALPAAILEKSQKTLENIQKTVAEATDEIQKTINENLSDLKTLESDMGKMSEDLTGSPLPFAKSGSLTSVIENRPSTATAGETDNAFGEVVQTSSAPPSHPIEASVTVLNPSDNHQPQSTANGNDGAPGASSGLTAADEDAAERVSERAISVLPEVDSESANLQSNDGGLTDGVDYIAGHARGGSDSKVTSADPNSKDGGSKLTGISQNQEDISKKAGSEDPLHAEKEQPQECCACSKCCKCSSCFCIPCRRSRCSKCCRKKSPDPEATALATVEVVNEKTSCWKKLKCCKRKPKPSHPPSEEPMHQRKMETISEEPERAHSFAPTQPKQSKCGLCISKVFCCRSVNKVEAASGDMEEVRKCCFCIPCRKKKSRTSSTSQPAWQDPGRPSAGSTTGQAALSVAPAGVAAAKGGCCSRFFQKLNCCKKKPPPDGSRRASMRGAVPPPTEDNRRKLHNDLVEYNSKMKGAIPVLPLYLAWFCMICNIIIPGLGTLLSGFFCICVGIPRFTQYDSAKARLGSFIINCIVAVAQMFCVLFCFVGWGWSIWWGTIMIKTARKLSKIKKVEKLELEEEKRQAEMAAIAALNATDVEAGKT